MCNLLAIARSLLTGAKTAEWNGHFVLLNIPCQKWFYTFLKDNLLWMMVFFTGDESLFHHFNPETKQQSMKRYHVISPKKKAEQYPQLVKLWETSSRITHCLILCPEVNHECRYLHTFRCVKL
jgi:hypothetical protein